MTHDSQHDADMATEALTSQGSWSNLPKYAQRALWSLTRETENLKDRIAELENGDDTTGVRACAGSSLTYYPLPKGQTYEFDMDLGAIQVHVRREHDGTWLAITSVNYELEVAPRASNVIYVRAVER